MRRLELEMIRSCPACLHYDGGHCALLDESVPVWFAPFGCDDFSQDVPF